MGVVGLALAFSIASIINMFLLYIFLHCKVPGLDDHKIFVSIIKIAINSILAGAVVYLSLQILANWVNMQTFLGIFIQGLGAAIFGGICYFILGIILKLEEVELLKKVLNKALAVFKNGQK